MAAKGISLYDVLGVTPGASDDTLRRAHDERVRQLSPDLADGAPFPVLAAASRARDSVDAAWLVLGDPARRRRYDNELRRRSGGLPAPGGFGADATAAADSADDPYELVRAGADLFDGAWAAFAALTAWLAPLPAPPRRRVTVPDVRGLFFRPCQAIATMAGLRLVVVRLTADPQPVEGLVVTQTPAAGAQARLQSTLTVHVWHPPRRSPLEGGARAG